jgi:SHS2 domain-containing protein
MSTHESLFEKWKFIEHTADVRMEVFGNSSEDLFHNAALGFADILKESADPEKTQLISLQINSDNIEDLLIDWLRELLYLHEAKKLLLLCVNSLSIKNNTLRASITAAPISETNQPEIELKGVTYHKFSIQKSETGYSAKIIFDI